MSTGTETIIINLELTGLNGTFQLNASLDTGFWGPLATLAIPEVYAKVFGLIDTDRICNYTTANGRNMPMNLYFGIVSFSGSKKPLLINVSPEMSCNLVGLSFLRIFDLKLAILGENS